MSLLDSLLTINISSTTTAPTRPGFGTGLIAAYHTRFANRVRKYTSVAAMVSDGFLTTDRAYILANAYFSQSPAPVAVKIGRRANQFTQIQHFVIKASPPTGETISMTIGGTTITRVNGSSETNTAVGTAIATLITAAAIPGVASAVSTSGDIAVTSTAGVLVGGINNTPAYVTYRNAVADPGLAADLTAIQAEDDDWYGLLLDSQGGAEITVASTWAESAKKLFVYGTADDAVVDGTSTTDIGYTEKNSAFAQTAGLFHRSGGGLTTIAAAMMGSRFTRTPGSDTWNMKNLAGIAADTLTDTEQAAATTKRVTTYRLVQGINFTVGGNVASGEWADVVRGLAWQRSDMQIGLLTLLTSLEKVPFTDTGVDMVKGVVRKSLKQGVANGLLAEVPAFVITAPAVADVSQANKSARTLPSVTWSATLAGAIHGVTVNGTTSV